VASETTQTPQDGQLSFLGGQDASKTPDKVPGDAVFAAINTTFKNGSLGPRNGFMKLPLIFPQGRFFIDGVVLSPTYENVFHSGKFQALIPYVTNNTPFLIIVVSGTIFLVNQNTLVVTYIPIAGGSRLNEYTPRLNWSLASNYIVIFDFPNLPVIIENQTARRSNLAADEVPISNIGTYNQNRLFIGNAGSEFTAGDPTGSLAAPSAPITFIEVNTVGSPYFGQVFQLPTNYINTPITAMGFLAAVDSSTGIGPLIIATSTQIFSVNSQNPRTAWEQGQFVSVAVSNTGIAGQQAMVNVNSDLFFVSGDGQIRTLSMSRQEQGKWSKVPLSREVRNWLKYSDPSLVQFSAMTYFDNKIFCTANPYRTVARTLGGKKIIDYAFGGLVVMELENISSLGNTSNPTWAGLWTGIRPTELCNNFERCFVMAKDDSGTNDLWEIDPFITVDKSGEKERYIKSTIYTKNYIFGDPFTYKELTLIDMPFNTVQGDFDLNVKYKPEESPNFLDWNSYSYKAPYRSCTFPDPCNFNGYAEHSFSELRFGAPESYQCDPVTGNLYRQFRKAQLKFTISARHWNLSEFKMKAVTIPQSDTDVNNCDRLPSVPLCLDCNDDWVIASFDNCDAPKDT